MNGTHTAGSTLVFAKDGDIIGAVRDHYSVAVETLQGEKARVYGKRRLVWYAHFLLENYYPVHDELCSISGVFMADFAKGDETAAAMIEKAEERIEKFERSFFGK